MQRDLLDALRCPNDHEESWLVAMVHRAEGTRLLDADLACPLCGAEFSIEHGVGMFGTAYTAPAAESPADTIPEASPDVTRLAAQLGVLGGLAPVLLAGRYAAVAGPYAALTGTPVVALNASPSVASSEAPGVSLLEVNTRLPLGAGTLAAAAFDGAAGTALASAIVRATRVRGRLVVPATLTLPDAVTATVRRIAQDETEWVGEVAVAASGLVELRRQPPSA